MPVSTHSSSSGDSGEGSSATVASSFTDETTVTNRYNGFSTLPSPRTESQSTFPRPKLPPCSCLQQQAQLVWELGDLQFSHVSELTIDRVLRGAQLAQRPWKNLMECKRCRNQEKQREVFLLFAMSIRILLFYFHELDAKSNSGDKSLEKTVKPSSPGLDVGVSIGIFEPTDEDKAQLIDSAIKRALQCTTSALQYLWDRIGRPRPLSSLTDGSNSASDIFAGIFPSPSSESQRSTPRQSSGPSAANLSTRDSGYLLNTLHAAIQAMRQDLRA